MAKGRHNSAENMVFIHLSSQNRKRSFENIQKMLSVDMERLTKKMQESVSLRE